MKAAACDGAAADATPTTWVASEVADAADILPMLFWTTEAIVWTAACTICMMAGLAAAADASETGAEGCVAPGGVYETIPALIVMIWPPIVKVTESAVDAMVTSPAVTEVEKAVPRAAATPLGVRTV